MKQCQEISLFRNKSLLITSMVPIFFDIFVLIPSLPGAAPFSTFCITRSTYFHKSCHPIFPSPIQLIPQFSYFTVVLTELIHNLFSSSKFLPFKDLITSTFVSDIYHINHQHTSREILFFKYCPK